MRFFDRDTPLIAKIYILVIIVPGSTVLALSAIHAFRDILDGNYQWLLLLALTFLGSFFPIIFYAKGENRGLIITVNDLFVFLGILIFNPAVAVLVSIVDGLLATFSARAVRSWGKALFNVSQLTLVTYLAARTFDYLQEERLAPLDLQAIPQFVLSLGASALLFFFVSHGLVSTAMGLATGRSMKEFWRTNFLLASITTFAGAAAAGLIFVIVGRNALAPAIGIPIVLITYHAFKVNQNHIDSLARSSSFLQSTLNSVSAYIGILDESGRILAVNQAWEEFPNKGALIGPIGSVGDALPDLLEDLDGEREAKERILNVVESKILSQRGGTSVEYSTGQGPEMRWFALRTSRFKDNEDYRIVIEFDDITARKQLEEQLRHSQKMEAIGRLAGGIAHDFNNILTIISGYGTFLHEAVGKDEDLKGHVETILEAADRAGAVTRQMLAFSRKQVLEPRIVEHNLLVVDTEKLLTRLIGEDIDLVTVLDPASGYIRVDPSQFAQVLINLAVNARDAMPTGGRLKVGTSKVKLAENNLRPTVAEAVRPGVYACLTVTDTGTGMSRETMDHIFEPFYTTKEKGKGTGLGLSTVYGIVKQSGGYIDVHSSIGKGTAFAIYLPSVEPDDTVDSEDSRPVIDSGLLRKELNLALEVDSGSPQRSPSKTPFHGGTTRVTSPEHWH